MLLCNCTAPQFKEYRTSMWTFPPPLPPMPLQASLEEAEQEEAEQLLVQHNQWQQPSSPGPALRPALGRLSRSLSNAGRASKGASFKAGLLDGEGCWTAWFVGTKS